MHAALWVDEHGLARVHVLDLAVAGHVERHALGGHGVPGALLVVLEAHHHGLDAKGSRNATSPTSGSTATTE
jgi:hypothetical protein